MYIELKQWGHKINNYVYGFHGYVWVIKKNEKQISVKFSTSNSIIHIKMSAYP